MGGVLSSRNNLLEDIGDLMYGPNLHIGSRRENQAKMGLQTICFLYKLVTK